MYVGFSSRHTSKSSVGGSVGSSKDNVGFPAVLKTMWDKGSSLGSLLSLLSSVFVFSLRLFFF